MGEAERHARFRLESGSRRALGVAFGVNGELTAAELAEPLDVSVELEVNEWNGAVEPRVVLGELYPGGSARRGEAPAVSGRRGVVAQARAEREAPLGDWPPRRHRRQPRDRTERRVVDRRGAARAVAAVAALASSGEPVLALCADALRRRELVERAAAPARFGGGAVAIASGRLADDAARAAVAEVGEAGTGVALADWAALARDALARRRRFEHVVADRPAAVRRTSSGWRPRASRRAAIRACTWPGATPSRAGAAGPRRGVASAPGPGGPVSGARAIADRRRCRDALCKAPPSHPRSPEVAGRRLRVLEELGRSLAGSRPAPRAPSASYPRRRAISSDSPAFVAYRERHEEGRRFLSKRRQPS